MSKSETISELAKRISVWTEWKKLFARLLCLSIIFVIPWKFHRSRELKEQKIFINKNMMMKNFFC